RQFWNRTSLTAMSCSIRVTVPFTTLPSKASFSPPRLSLRRAAKSSRVGNVVVAMSVCSPVTSIGPAAWRATMASLHMRTWLHVLPPEHHAPEASFGLAHRRGQPDAQKRAPRRHVRADARPGAVHARGTVRARQRDGLSRGEERPPDGPALSLEGAWGQ